jgi:Iron-containing redox enzyme
MPLLSFEKDDKMNAQDNTRRLRQKIGLVFPSQAASAHALMTHPRLIDLYPDYLFLIHCIARAAVPVMEAARARAEEMAPADPVAALLTTYLEKHIPEEHGHAEWMLEDLEEIGGRRADILDRVPSSTLASLTGAQYYWIYHYHPVALIGYLAVVEGYPPTVELVQDLMSRTGYGRKAFRSLHRHALLEPGHRDSIDEVLDTLPLTAEQTALIGVSALHTVNTITTAFQELLDRCPLLQSAVAPANDMIAGAPVAQPV